MSDAFNDIVMTGAGLATPLGLTRGQTWSSVLAMRCGMGPLTAMEQPVPPGADGGQAPDLPADFEPDLPRETRYLRHAILEAIGEAGAWRQLPYRPGRRGIILGTTLHGMRRGGLYFRNDDPRTLGTFLAAPVLRDAAGSLDFRGCGFTTCSACSSSLGAVALALTLLRSGQLDFVLAGGYDAISEYVYGGFNSLRLVAPGPLRPFARDRRGMKLAEGYGIVVLERGPQHGHVFFLLGRDANGNLVGIGGNEGNRVSIASFDPKRVLAMVWPASVPIPPSEPLPVLASTGRLSTAEA